MKKTVYFTCGNNNSNGYNWMSIDKAIQSAVEKRDQFLENNTNEIGRIDNEDLKIFTMQNTQTAIVVIQLTYFPK